MSTQLWTSLILLLFSVWLSFFVVGYENFIASPDNQRCGVDMLACPFGKRCANGFCINTNPSALPQHVGIPVFP